MDWATLYNAGRTVQSIADEAGVSYWTARDRLLKAGVKFRSRGVQAHVTPEQRRERLREKSNRQYHAKKEIFSERRKLPQNVQKRRLKESAAFSSSLDYRMRKLLRNRLNAAIRGGQKTGSAVRDLGCTIPELRAYLEAKFYPHPRTDEAMEWVNWSPTGWHIDHVKPLVSFDLTDREQLLQACHYTNLQPLWAEWNLRKGCRG